MRCVVNFTPVLLEQLDDYAQQFKPHLENGSRFANRCSTCWPASSRYPLTSKLAHEIVRACRRAHAPLMIDVHPRFVPLFDMVMTRGRRACRRGRSGLHERAVLSRPAELVSPRLAGPLAETTAPGQGHCWSADGVFDKRARRKLLQDHVRGLRRSAGALPRIGRERPDRALDDPLRSPDRTAADRHRRMHCSLPEAEGPEQAGLPRRPGARALAYAGRPSGVRTATSAAGRKASGCPRAASAPRPSNCSTNSASPGAHPAKASGTTAVFFPGWRRIGEEARRSLFCAHAVRRMRRHACSSATTACPT